MTCPRERTFISWSLSAGSLRPLETIRRRAPATAIRTDNDGSDNKVKRRGTVVGVTVRLMSTQPVPKAIECFNIRRKFRLQDEPAYEPKVLMPQSTTSRTS